MERRAFITLLGGAAVAWPVAARAQQDDRVRRVGFLSTIAEGDPQVQGLVGEFVQRLQELGWANGRNVRIDFRFGDVEAVARLATLTTELVELGPDVIFALGGPAASAVRQQTLSIPIVFVQVVDPVAAGFVTNLARPEKTKSGPYQIERFWIGASGGRIQLLHIF